MRIDQTTDSITDLQDRLEAEVDRFSMPLVLAALEQICYAKADHLRENWQDEYTGDAWERAGVLLDRLSADINF